MTDNRQRERRARKARTYRQRQRAGVAVLRAEVLLADFELALSVRGLISELRVVDRREVEAAASAILDAWARGWLRHYGHVP